MSKLVVLDTGPLGMLAHAKLTPEREQCLHWLQGLLTQGVQVRVAEISDYELRRELKQIQSNKSIQKLDHLGATLGYIPITTEAMRQAAEMWAKLRSTGRVAASKDALDGDVILAAQATVEASHDSSITAVVVATTNVRHLSWMIQAAEWQNIQA